MKNRVLATLAAAAVATTGLVGCTASADTESPGKQVGNSTAAASKDPAAAVEAGRPVSDADLCSLIVDFMKQEYIPANSEALATYKMMNTRKSLDEVKASFAKADLPYLAPLTGTTLNEKLKRDAWLFDLNTDLILTSMDAKDRAFTEQELSALNEWTESGTYLFQECASIGIPVPDPWVL